MEKVLHDGVYSPLWMSRVGGIVTIRNDARQTFRLGPRATKWLMETLLVHWRDGSAEETGLVHMGKVVLSVSTRFPMTRIKGQRAEITLSSDMLKKLIEWLPVE